MNGTAFRGLRARLVARVLPVLVREQTRMGVFSSIIVAYNQRGRESGQSYGSKGVRAGLMR